jgi:hypothetical protein
LSVDAPPSEIHTFSLRLSPGACKPRQQLPSGVVTFVVVSGEEGGLEVALGPPEGGETLLRFGPGDHFYLGAPNVYALTNVGKAVCIVSATLVVGREGRGEMAQMPKERMQWRTHFKTGGVAGEEWEGES